MLQRRPDRRPRRPRLGPDPTLRTLLFALLVAVAGFGLQALVFLVLQP